MSVLLLQFVAISAVIVLAGSNLSRYGDVIAEKTGLGRAWIGVVLIASVTSLPELAGGLSAIGNGLPDIAVGDVLGSCMFNLLILAILDTLDRSAPITARAHQGHAVAAGFGVLLLALTTLRMATGDALPALGWVSSGSVLSFAIYLIAVRVIFLYERRRLTEYVEERAEALAYQGYTLRWAAALYGVNAVFVVGAAYFLPLVAAGIATEAGLDQSFVGTLLVALTTSLPELVVSLAALRLGAIDMIFGNLFGSTLFNIAILAVEDVAFTGGPLLASVDPAHVISGLTAIAMTAIVLISVSYRASRGPLPIAWDSIALLITYGGGLYLLLTQG